MLGRPAPLWIVAVLGLIGGVLCIIVAMQFAEVMPWAGDEASYVGGRWTGVLAYAGAAVFFFAAAYAWITVKPWAHMVAILAALIGFAVPFMGYMDGTDPRSSAIAPLVVSVLMLFMVFRPSTNRAMAAVLSGQGSGKAAKTPPPPKPMSAARKRELAAEEKKAKTQAPNPATASPAASVATSTAVATSPAVPASPTAAPATPTQTAASMVLSAASSLRSAAATPASPRKGVTTMVKPGTLPQQAPPPPPAQPTAKSVPGLRADDI